MREIKFRAWDNKGKCMVPWGTMMQTAFNSGEQHFLYDIFCGHRLDVVLMQYIGLKDKNGKEIYESDIVVYYLMDHNGDEECYRETVTWGVCGFDMVLPTSCYEVIGNIYENPELIDPQED